MTGGDLGEHWNIRNTEDFSELAAGGGGTLTNTTENILSTLTAELWSRKECSPVMAI